MEKANIEEGWRLMYNNITREDLEVVSNFLLQNPQPVLTHNKKVIEFEELWSKWLGVKYSVFVNSGSSANVITMAILSQITEKKKIIIPPLTWVSDISSIIHAKLEPVFCDINLKTLAIDENELRKVITKDTAALFLTHILGYNGLTDGIIKICKDNNVLLIEDSCESYGATFQGRKVGSIGKISNFSYFYSHALTSIEGGMISTNDEEIYQLARIIRSHGLLRECTNSDYVTKIQSQYPDLNSSFIFLFPAYNMRSTEVNAVLAINQLKKLDKNNKIRAENLKLFLDNLDSNKYFTDFNTIGNSNYAFTLLLKQPDFDRRNLVEKELNRCKIEFRRGMSGGGNQLRQPYLRKIYGDLYKKYPNTDFVHHFGWYIGNYPTLEKEKIIFLTNLLNEI